jgi:tetratricopeptide (TPR) repeat protein
MVRTGWMGHYQPLSWISLALDALLGGPGPEGGLDPAPFHATNLALHALAALAVYALARRCLELCGNSGLGALGGSAFAALFFALHPLRVESVAWVTERRDVLSAPFFVMAVWCWLGRSRSAPASALKARDLALAVALAGVALALFLGSVDRSHPGVLGWGALGAGGLALAAAAWLGSVVCAARAAPSGARWQLAASAALLLVSLGAKAWGIVMPAVLLVCDAWPLRRQVGAATSARGWIALLAEKAPFAALSAVFGVLAGWAQGSQAGTLRTLADHGLGERAAQASYGLWFYPSRTLVPVDLGPIYELPRELSLSEPRFLLPALFVAALTAILVMLRKRWPAALAAWIAFAAIVSPVLGVLQSGLQLVADRYAYLSTIPLALLAGAGMAWVLARAPHARVPTLALGFAWVAALAFASRAQSLHWIDSERLWTRAVAVQPASAMAHLGLGFVELERALAEPDRARRKAALEATGARFELGLQHRELPRLYTNLSLVESSLAELDPERAQARIARSVELSHRALALVQEHGGVEPHLLLSHGVVLARAGRTAEALPYIEAFVRERPDDPAGHMRLAGALFVLQRTEEARRSAQRAVELDPGNAKARAILRSLGG